MPHSRAQRRSPDTYDFVGTGDEARDWLDTAFGANLRLGGPFGTVRHQRDDHGGVAFDHITIDAHFTFDSDPMPALVVVDVLGGNLTYTRDRTTDLSCDGDTVLVAGWDMPFAGRSDGYDVSYIKEIAPGSDDQSVLQLAFNEQRILLTEDKDFGELTVRLKLPAHGIILLRINPADAGTKLARLREVLLNHSARLAGSLAVVDEAQARFRLLSSP